MYVLALTGGLAAGKSTATRVFAERGALVIDTDDVAKGLLDEVPVVKERVVAAFGDGVLAPDGRVDRAALARAAFATPEGTMRLNAIVHPAVGAAVAGALDALSTSNNTPPVVVLVVPLLAESPQLLELVDAVLAISSAEDVRIERAVARGMTYEDADNRVARQAGDAERREIADYVIENDSSLDEFHAALVDFWEAEIARRLP